MSRDTKAFITFVITMAATWVSYWIYIIGNNIVHSFIGYGTGSGVNARIGGIFLAGVVVVFPTYKLTKKYIWKK